MSAIVILKFFHFLALFFAGGIGIGGAVVQSVHLKAGRAPSPLVAKAIRILAFLGLIALLVIWITGIGLHHSLYGGAFINHAFTAKLIGAGLLLLFSAIGNYHLYQSAKAQKAPNPSVMKPLLQGQRVALVVVLLGAAIAFSS